MSKRTRSKANPDDETPTTELSYETLSHMYKEQCDILQRLQCNITFQLPLRPAILLGKHETNLYEKSNLQFWIECKGICQSPITRQECYDIAEAKHMIPIINAAIYTVDQIGSLMKNPDQDTHRLINNYKERVRILKQVHEDQTLATTTLIPSELHVVQYRLYSMYDGKFEKADYDSFYYRPVYCLSLLDREQLTSPVQNDQTAQEWLLKAANNGNYYAMDELIEYMKLGITSNSLMEFILNARTHNWYEQFGHIGSICYLLSTLPIRNDSLLNLDADDPITINTLPLSKKFEFNLLEKLLLHGPSHPKIRPSHYLNYVFRIQDMLMMPEHKKDATLRYKLITSILTAANERHFDILEDNVASNDVTEALDYLSRGPESHNGFMRLAYTLISNESTPAETFEYTTRFPGDEANLLKQLCDLGWDCLPVTSWHIYRLAEITNNVDLMKQLVSKTDCQAGFDWNAGKYRATTWLQKQSVVVPEILYAE